MSDTLEEERTSKDFRTKKDDAGRWRPMLDGAVVMPKR